MFFILTLNISMFKKYYKKEKNLQCGVNHTGVKLGRSDVSEIIS